MEALASYPRSAHLGPGAVGVAAGGATHGLRTSVDVDAMHEVAATRAAPLVVVLGDHLAVAAVVRIAPADRTARRPTLPGVELGLAGELAVAHVERAADLVADNAADHGAGERGGDAPAALAELVADDAAGDRADHRAGVLLLDIGTTGRERKRRGEHDCHRTLHGNLPSPRALRRHFSARRNARCPHSLTPEFAARFGQKCGPHSRLRLGSGGGQVASGRVSLADK